MDFFLTEYSITNRFSIRFDLKCFCPIIVLMSGHVSCASPTSDIHTMYLAFKLYSQFNHICVWRLPSFICISMATYLFRNH